MKIREFDLKTGKALGLATEPKQKSIDHGYLEDWLTYHAIDAEIWTAKYYPGVEDEDRSRLEAEGKFFIGANRSSGYFVDADTLNLMVFGNKERGIEPIFAGNRDAVHYATAYLGPVLSEGNASTAVSGTPDQPLRILVVDDEARSHGEKVLLDRFGQPVPEADLERLYDKMGDGTMLLTSEIVRNLLTEADYTRIAQSQSLDQDLITPEIAAELDAKVAQLVDQTVSQFRAATPDFPGIMKGTFATSQWCERLGVAAIISKNCIKGADDRLSDPGIKEVSSFFWVNRKLEGEYRSQVVGPQVKGCIPEATRLEFNPRLQQAAESFAAIASNSQELAQSYIRAQQQQDRPTWVEPILTADPHGWLLQARPIVRELEEFSRTEWLDLATGGIYIPTAIAQHHAQLMPWEICNRDLPHGAIVAYYRSPFPNVGAAAIAINNTEILKTQDPEAFSKHGTAYLNPWTAKNVAIIDFDGDAPGFFVSYQASNSRLPAQIRTRLASLQNASPAEQYEAARSLFSRLISTIPETPNANHQLQPASYPLTGKEIIDRTDPDQKPREITKQKKVKHTWLEHESFSEAAFRAWKLTAENQTGMVANAGMTLQSLALETRYVEDNRKEVLLRQISAHYQKLLNRVESGTLEIPTDEEFEALGFPPYHLLERITEVANANRELGKQPDPTARQAYVQAKLDVAYGIMQDMVEGPNAENLQTAVDSLKSSRGINLKHHQLIRALAYKAHEMREHQNDPAIYTNGRHLPTNVQEPIGWAVEAVNGLYEEAQLPTLPNAALRSLFPKSYTREQAQLARDLTETYNLAIKQARATQERLQQKNRADQQPTMIVTVPQSGSQITIQRLCDVNDQATAPIWRAEGIQPNWRIGLSLNDRVSQRDPERLIAVLFVEQNGEWQSQLLGFVAPESVKQHDLETKLRQRSVLAIQSPIVELRPPFAVENDAKDQVAEARRRAEAKVEAIPERDRTGVAAALWTHSEEVVQIRATLAKAVVSERSTISRSQLQHSEGIGLALKYFTQEVCQQLQSPPSIKLRGIQHETNEVGFIPDGAYPVRFSQYTYTPKNSEAKTVPSISIITNQGDRQFASISDESMRLPIGTVAVAKIQIPLKDSLTVTIKDHPVTITKLSTTEFANTAFTGHKAAIAFGYDRGEAIAQIAANGEWSVLGQIDSSSQRWLKQQGLLNNRSWQTVSAIVDRAAENIAMLEVVQVMPESEITSVKLIESSDLTQSELKIISGGQTGADQGGLIGAQRLGVPTGGTAPKNYRTEAGFNPSLQEFGLIEDTSSHYERRTEQNILNSDGTVLFGDRTSAGSRLTQSLAQQYGKPVLNIDVSDLQHPEIAAMTLRQWVEAKEIHTLNVAGNRESKCPGLCERVAAIVESAFREPLQFKSSLTQSEQTPSEAVTIVGKPVPMVFDLRLHGEANPLPVKTCIEAMRGYGRCHTTRNYDPCAFYGFKAGDIAIAYSGSQQVAFRVGEQYRITPEMIADPIYQQRWAAMEKHSAKELLSFRDKSTWGLHIEPLGDYINGKIVPFAATVPQQDSNLSAELQLNLFNISEQQARVEIVAPIVFEFLSVRNCQSVSGTENTAVYDSEAQTLTVTDNQTNETFLVACYADQAWHDRGSNISESKMRYFLNNVQPAIDAYRHNQQTVSQVER